MHLQNLPRATELAKELHDTDVKLAELVNRRNQIVSTLHSLNVDTGRELERVPAVAPFLPDWIRL